MKLDFIERNIVAVFKTLQVVYIILACIEAFDHKLAGAFSNLIFVVAIEMFIKAAQLEKRKDAVINLHIDYYKLDGEEDEEEEKIGNEEKPNLEHDPCIDESNNLVKIKKGCNYLCLRNIPNLTTGRIAFIKGKIYQATNDDELVEEDDKFTLYMAGGTSGFRLVE